MKKNNLLVLSILVLFSVISCKNFMNGDEILTSLEQAVEYQQSPFAGILLTCDAKACKSMIPEVGKIEDKKSGDSFELQFEETEEYYFEKWVAEPEESVEFEDASSKKTKVTVVNADSPIIIKPVCHTRKVLTVNFVGENGSTYPFETKKYYSGEVFDISFSESVGFAFVNWSYSVVSGEQNPLTIASAGNIQTSVKVGELTKDSEITITAHSAKRPDVISSAPGKNVTGTPLNSIITVYFDNEMDESSIYYSEKELYELGVTDSEGNLTGNYIKLTDSERENKCYGYQLIGDDNSIVFKNITIYNRDDSTQNYLKYYKDPRFDSSHKKLEIPTNENICLPVAKNILVAISSQMGTMVGEKLVHMEKDLIWYYFTANEEDSNPPTVELSASAILDSKLSALPTDSNQVITKFSDIDYQKSIHLNENRKILLSGTMRDVQSGVAYLSWTLNKLKYERNTLERTSEETGYINNFTYAGAIASFVSENNTNSAEIDLSSILTSTKDAVGMYEVSVNVVDNCGNKSKNLNFYFYFDKYVSPVSDFYENRVSDSSSTLKWYNPKENDLERIEIYYDDKKYNPTEEEKDKLLSQNQSLGVSVNIKDLVPDHKYEYKAILFDKFGNSSLTVFVDNEPPSFKTNFLSYEVISKNTVELKITRPISKGNKYTAIRFSEPEKYTVENFLNNTTQTQTITLKNKDNNRFNTSFTIEDYDYSGNKTESTYEIKAEPKEGFYYYKDQFWSKNKIEGKDSDLLGIICYTGGNALLGDDVRIIALSNFEAPGNIATFYTAYAGAITDIKNGKIEEYKKNGIDESDIDNYKTIASKIASDGRRNYDIIRNQYPAIMNITVENYPKQNIWPYLNDLNKNIDINNQKYFVWYVPSYVEMEHVLKNKPNGYVLDSTETFITSSFGKQVWQNNERTVTKIFIGTIGIKKDGTIQKIGYLDNTTTNNTVPQNVRLMAQVPLE